MSDAESTESMPVVNFEPAIGEEVMFCPADGNDHLVTIVAEPKEGTTKWLTSEGSINACYLKQVGEQ